MIDYRFVWTQAVAKALSELSGEGEGLELSPDEVPVESPPDVALGDLAVPMFSFARHFRKSPAAIATDVVAIVSSQGLPGRVEASGPYLNVFLPRPEVSMEAVSVALANPDSYGQGSSHAGQRVTIEFSSPNTNKPLHVGHLRNDALGESVARALAACGADVRKVNLINDRGIHICKSMLAYQKTGEGRTPEGEGSKGDHFVGDYYVAYNNWAKEDPSAEEQAREMLLAWEGGDEEVLKLWKLMNGWTLSGLKETYRSTGIEFDQFYFESETYQSGRSEVLQGLEKGVFTRDAEGTVWVDLEPINLDRKVLLRKDGTSLYLTQDIGTVIKRYEDAPFDRMIYVVASEQNYHFTVLFYVLRQLGFGWADHLHHLSYGMVNLPDGRMKSREGTVVDADDIIAELEGLALEEIRAKDREDKVGDVAETTHNIAIGALHYFLLQVTPTKDMTFNPKESLSFTGNTGPYLQYMCARISSLLRKAKEMGLELDGGPATGTEWAKLSVEEEWKLVRAVLDFPQVVAQVARELNPSILTAYLYELARTFSSYYADHPILQPDDTGTRGARLSLSGAVLVVLRQGLGILNIPFLEVM